MGPRVLYSREITLYTLPHKIDTSQVLCSVILSENHRTITSSDPYTFLNFLCENLYRFSTSTECNRDMAYDVHYQAESSPLDYLHGQRIT